MYDLDSWYMIYPDPEAHESLQGGNYTPEDRKAECKMHRIGVSSNLMIMESLTDFYQFDI
jgi:hypothetical protein